MIFILASVCDFRKDINSNPDFEPYHSDCHAPELGEVITLSPIHLASIINLQKDSLAIGKNTKQQYWERVFKNSFLLEVEEIKL